MATVLSSDQGTSRQLCFVWGDSPVAEAPRKTRSRPKRDKQDRHAQPLMKDGAHKPLEPVAESPVRNLVLVAPVRTKEQMVVQEGKALRTGRTEHISGLMVAVLARYGIDANEFLAEEAQ